MKYELQSIISAIGRNSKTNLISATAYHIGENEEAGGNTQANKLTKDQEAKRLTAWLFQRIIQTTYHLPKSFNYFLINRKGAKPQRFFNKEMPRSKTFK